MKGPENRDQISSRPEAMPAPGETRAGIIPAGWQPMLSNALFLLLATAVLALSVSIAASSIAFGTAAVVMIVLLIARRTITPVRTPLDYAILAYCLAEIVSTVFSVDKPTSLLFSKRLFLILTVPMVAVSVDSERRLRQLIAALLAVNAALSVIESLLVLEIGGLSLRLGVFQHYMTAGGIKMFMLLLALPLVAGKGVPRGWRIFAIATFTPTLLALVLTETRSSWLGFVAGAAVIGVIRNRGMLAALAVIVAAFLIFAPQQLRTRAFSIFDTKLHSNVERMNKLVVGWRILQDYPAVGVGDIDLGIMYDQYKLPNDTSHGGHLHNNTLMFLVTLGIVGFCAITALFLRMLQTEYRLLRRTAGHWLFGNVCLGALAAAIGFHVNGLFEWNFGDHEIAVLLWMTVGMAIVSGRLFEQAGHPA